MKLWEFLKEKMQRHLNQTVCEKDTSMTFEEIIVFAESFAKQLKGVRCCAVFCGSEMAAGMAVLSCLAADVTVLPLSQRYGTLHCTKILDVVSPDAVIFDQDGDLQLLHITDTQYVDPAIRPALIMCTSGTTGIPKGAMLTEENIMANVQDIAAYFDIRPSDTILIARPLYHCAVLTGEFLTALVKGTNIRFCSEFFTPAIVLDLLERYPITAFCATPTLLRMIARFKREPRRNRLKHIGVSGECMSVETGKYISHAFPRADIYHLYGLTEACPRVAYLPPKLFGKYADCVGLPLHSVSLKIISEKGESVEEGERGILWVKGPNVMIGYYNNPEKTAQVIKDGWLCTGDIASVNEKGLLKIHGRSDDLIIKAGMNIYPGEIEAAVKKDPRVEEVLVYARTDDTFGVQLVMEIVGDFSGLSEIKKMCRERLPLYQIPSKIHWVKEIPRNGSGKVVRK